MEKQTVVSGLAQAHCACCERTVSGSKLRKTTWEVGGKEEHDYICYACLFNTFPPGHPLFERVQAWRAARGKSTVLATPERIAQFKGGMRVGTREAKVQVQVSSELRKANDLQMVHRMLHMASTGQIADPRGQQCYVCSNLLGDPVVVQFSEVLGGKRRAQWVVCSQACADEWAKRTQAAIYRQPALAFRTPRYDERNRLIGYHYPGQGFKALSKAGGEPEPLFCRKCDKLEEVCECEGGPAL